MPLPVEPKRPSRALVRDEIHASLRGWIIGGVLRPGERVRDVDIADQLGVSRTPVREALRRLEDEGLIETEANRWTRVSLVDVDAAEQIYPIVRVLECLALELTGLSMATGALAELRDANERMEAALERNDPEGASKANADFHALLVAGSGNPELMSVTKGLHLKIRRAEIAYFGGPTMVAASGEEHRAVIDALASRDLAAAQEALREHWQASVERARTSLHATQSGAEPLPDPA
jgi:DNA-binding GntR family transcriptional regulator